MADLLAEALKREEGLREDAEKFRWCIRNMLEMEKIFDRTGKGISGDWGISFSNAIGRARFESGPQTTQGEE